MLKILNEKLSLEKIIKNTFVLDKSRLFYILIYKSFIVVFHWKKPDTFVSERFLYDFSEILNTDITHFHLKLYETY